MTLPAWIRGAPDDGHHHPTIRWAGREGTTTVLVTGASLSAGGVWLVVSQALAHDYDWFRWVFVLGVGFTALGLGGRDRWDQRALRRDGVEARARVVERWMRGERTFIALSLSVGESAPQTYQGEVSLDTYDASKPGSEWRVRVLPRDPRVMQLIQAV